MKIKSILFIILVYVISITYFTIGLPILLLNESFVYHYVRFLMKFFIHLMKLFGIKSEIINPDKIPKKSAIICSNHQSYYEIALLFSCVKKPVFVLKASLMRIPIFNLYFKKMGMIPVVRTSLNQNWQSMAIEQLRMGKQIIIFPEGTRVPVGEKVSYKLGAFKLAKNMNMQIIPVKTNSGEIWSGPGILKKKGTAYIKFYDPIDPDPDLLREIID